MFIEYSKLQWLGEFEGRDIGHNDIEIIAKYRMKDYPIYMHVDVGNHEVLTVWREDEATATNEPIVYVGKDFDKAIEMLKKDGVILDEL